MPGHARRDGPENTAGPVMHRVQDRSPPPSRFVPIVPAAWVPELDDGWYSEETAPVLPSFTN
jgi:hypothetical protein